MSAAVIGDRVVAGDVTVEDGRIVAFGVAPGGHPARIAVAGLIDLQVNGVHSVDFSGTDPAGWQEAGAALAAAGTTSFQPTLITNDPERTCQALGAIPERAGPAKVIGAHLEGPFISPERLGAHPARWRRDPDQVLLRRFLQSGAVRHLTLAPELEGGLELIRTAAARGVTVACGHSEATAAQAASAFRAGALAVTHLYNAMSLGDHHHPGLALAALADPTVGITVIADGTHVSNEALLVAWRAAPGRVALISDQVPDHLSALPLHLDGNVWRRPDGTLAGSASPLVCGVRHLVGLGVGLGSALAAATTIPARLAGRGSGSITPGSTADVVVFDDNLDIQAVWIDGSAVGPT